MNGCVTVKSEHGSSTRDLPELQMANICHRLPGIWVSLDVLGLAFILAYFHPINDKFTVFVFKICLLAGVKSRCSFKSF